jgi:hypothetical protein
MTRPEDVETCPVTPWPREAAVVVVRHRNAAPHGDAAIAAASGLSAP